LNWTVSTFGFNMIIYLMIVGAFHAALYYRDLRARQLREVDLAARLARSELNVLRMQLQPHFFFNALHTVSSLMLTDVPTAHRVITALGDLLRSSIDHTAHQEITLREELTFVRRYVDIQHARFRNRLDVQALRASLAARASSQHTETGTRYCVSAIAAARTNAPKVRMRAGRIPMNAPPQKAAKGSNARA